MWKNSLKNVEYDNNKIVHETLIDFFYSNTVLTFLISLVYVLAIYDTTVTYLRSIAA